MGGEKMNTKLKWLLIFLGALGAGAVASAVYVEVFQPKLDYKIEDTPIMVLYTDVPLDFETLVRNASYIYDDYVDTTAINVTTECSLELGFQFVDSTHFSAFTVQLWNRTASPYVLVDSFDMTSGPVTIDINTPTELGYNFEWTVAEDAPCGDTGTVELNVTFTEP